MAVIFSEHELSGTLELWYVIVVVQGMSRVDSLVINLNDDSSDDDEESPRQPPPPPATRTASSTSVTASSLELSIDALLKNVRASVEQVSVSKMFRVDVLS